VLNNLQFFFGYRALESQRTFKAHLLSSQSNTVTCMPSPRSAPAPQRPAELPRSRRESIESMPVEDPVRYVAMSLRIPDAAWLIPILYMLTSLLHYTAPQPGFCRVVG
jgi:hypothetical protein